MIDLVNDVIKKLGRILIPINYTKTGQFDHDLAIPIPPIPVLSDVEKLGKLDPMSDEYRFLYTRLRREYNKVAHALSQAEKLVSKTLEELSTIGGRE